ncbi:hypothetical protein ACW9IB_20280 [Pseudomonas sp. SDO524_S393]
MPSKSVSANKTADAKLTKNAEKKTSKQAPASVPPKTIKQPSGAAKKQASKKLPKQPLLVDDLDPPYTVPLPVVPVDGAAYGIGRRHIEDGLTYVFERWFNCNVGDEFEIWHNGILMASDEVTLETADDSQFFLLIPRSTLLLNFVDPVFGLVRRIGSGNVSTSPSQRILILNTLPGGEGNCDGNYHTGLTFTLSHTVIDSVVANQGVDVVIHRWQNMRVNDLVMFYWGEYRYELPPITAAQVGNNLEFTIEPEFLKAAGDGHFVVQFFVYDEVLDLSGPCHRWSKPIPVEVDLDSTLLPEPEIDEADPVTMILEADKLHGLPATGSVLIKKNDPNFLATDFLIWTVEGTTPDGEDVSYGIRVPVVLAGYNDIAIPNEFVRSLIESTLKICYARERGMLRSRPSIYTIGGIRYTLPKPSVVQAHGPFVEPDLPYITVAMPDYQPPGNAGDNLQVSIIGEHLDGSVEHAFSNSLAGSHPRLRDFVNAIYAPFEGLHNTRAHYIVTGPTMSRESERRYFQVGRAPRTLIAPLILEADATHNIDPKAVGSSASLEARAEFKAGDEVIFKFVGSATGTEYVTYVLAVNSNPLAATVARKLIEDNLDGTLAISYTRKRFGATELSEEVIYTIGRALGELFLPEVLEVTVGTDELDPRLVAVTGATVRCRYDAPKNGDSVEVCWVGLAGGGTHFATQDANTGDPYVDVPVPPEVIGFNIHPAGRDIFVSFRVIRNTVPTDSPVYTLKLLTLSDLDGPRIDSIGDSAVLEIPKLVGSDRTRVAPWLYAALGQRMWLDYTGEFATGEAYYEDTYAAREAQATDVASGPAPFSPVARLQLLKEWTPLAIRFGVTFNRTSNLADIVWFNTRHHMVQTEPNVFPHPQIKYANPATGPVVNINPIAVENKCQVLVTYPNMNLGGTDRITLYWILADGTAIDVGTLNGLDGGTVTFNISNDLVGRSIFSTIDLQYEVILGRGGEGSSEVQKVNVQAIAQASLPRALINGVANGGTINPANLSGNAMLTMAKWPFSQKDQFGWITVSAPGAVTQDLLVAHAVTAIEAANGFANIAVLRSWLLSVPNNGTVTVTPHVNFHKKADKTKAVAFPQTQYRIVHTTALVFNQSTVYLNRPTYLIPGNPDVLPAFGPGNQVHYQASGGTGPYFYFSSNGSVVNVTSSGLVTVRGNGTATVSVRDSSWPAQTRSYTVVVSNVVLCYGLGRERYANIRQNAINQGLRLPSLDEARAIHAAFGNSWPMGFANYWTSTFSHSFLFSNYYYTVNLNNGAVGTEKDHLLGGHCNGVGIR